MKQKFKSILPSTLKLHLRLLQRYFHESKNKYIYSKSYNTQPIGRYKNEILQPIKKSEFHENKIHNLNIVHGKINHLVINPNETFSFWKIVGKPNKKNNFKEGRNLIQNNISSEIGGGICQFSSIIYFLALQSGLKILERHSHSIDIYMDQERFTPLGSDSTVVYGYKDLQIQNPYEFPIQFECNVNENELRFYIISPYELQLNTINFEYSENSEGVWVKTFSNGKKLLENFYIRL